MTPVRDYDLLVLGGNMVGAVFALAMRNAGYRIALVEQKPPAEIKPADAPVGVRVSAIIRSVERVFKNLGVWQQMTPERIQPFYAMQVWQSAFPQAPFVFEASEVGEPNLGHIIENDQIQAAAWACLKADAQVDLFVGQAVVDLGLDDSAVVCALADGTQLTAKLLVGADGLASPSRQLAGIDWSEVDYGQSVIVANVYPQQSHQQACWQNYRDSGPFAFLPLADGGCSIAWYMPPEQIAQKMALSDTDFCREISHESGEALGQVLSVNARAAFSLKKRHAKTYVKDRVVLIGDAAHTVHPMAGQGANLGMLDAVTLAETLVSMRRSGQAFWTQSALQAYEKRRLDNYIIQQSMDVFAQSFQPLPKPLSWLRAKMMQATNRFVPLKAQMIRYALGDGRDLPALAKRVNE